MRLANLKKSKNSLHCFVISAFLILMLVFPLEVLAQDSNSINVLRQMGKAFAKIAEQASPAVVGIKAEKAVEQDYSTQNDLPFGFPQDPFGDDFFDHFFHRRSPNQHSPQAKHREEAQGSGFIISPEGYILTNNHLVGGAEKVWVRLRENEAEIEAKIIGTDPESDVAVIKIEEKNLPTVQLADSDTLEVGEWVIAIGNPFGLSHTVTAGIVSAKGRSNVGLTAYEDFIQTDAAINPGNSGGPLLNLDGKVVGINAAIISRSGGNMGIGLAIPINMAKAVYEQLVNSGTVVRGFLGVMPQDLTSELATSLGLKDTKGVILPEVTEGSAADKAGLKKGDIVVEFKGQPVESADSFRKQVAMLKPGSKVEIVVLREGNRKKFTAELAERPKQGQNAAGEREPDMLEQLGFAVENLSSELAGRLGYEGMAGVVVTRIDPDSQAAQKGITTGTLIEEVNQKQIKNTDDFNREIGKAGNEGNILLLVRQGRYKQYVPLKLQKK